MQKRLQIDTKTDAQRMLRLATVWQLNLNRMGTHPPSSNLWRGAYCTSRHNLLLISSCAIKVRRSSMIKLVA
ncbi:hypothetical protein DSM14862_00009 [Sulfitobacter indolifex]|nr:hypothetical protein DSM14862_00009 [Sulfitobacter indolifex]